MNIEVVSPEGRLVEGHPIRSKPAFDDRTKQPKTDRTGQQMNETFLALAIPKIPGVDWKATDWGQVIVGVGRSAFPNESLSDSFAWKIRDGDSAVVNQRGIRWCDKEGFPGHWVIMMSTMFSVSCYHKGRYSPQDIIQDVNAIKCGDYLRVNFEVASNNSTQSPGVYLNPSLAELCREGVAIIPVGKDASAVFGGQPQQQQYAAPPPETQAAPPPNDIAPAPGFSDGPKTYNLNGKAFTADQLKASGWTDDQIATLPN